MTKIGLTYLIAFLLIILQCEAQIIERERPEGWKKLVYGGRFMDRFLPMPDLHGMTADTWGADAVVPRDINNGIEEAAWSYWGGNIRLMDDGKYHLFVCRWSENAPKGHMEWPNSQVVHTVSDNPSGPFKVKQEVGKGHNPEWYITSNGQYVIYVIDGYYVSDNINGPWKYGQFDFDNRDRDIIEGLSNLSFAKREDGSFVMICRGGGVWISRDGLSTWNQVSNSTIYPPVDGRFEDPVIWKTEVQYHLIVNDWYGRIAWYLRSKDGINWKVDSGEAYLPGIARYADGTKEEWFKYERIKVLQDEYGRVTQASFAVIDTLKRQDLPNDNHSSKLITIPLSVGKRISITNKKPIDAQTNKITVLLKAEEGFDPHTDINLESLIFGAPEKVDFGLGSKAEKIEKAGRDAVITFNGKGNGITADNFAAKLLGKDQQGKLLFGYSRLPGTYIEPALSARRPLYTPSSSMLKVDVENFGQIASSESIIHVYRLSGEERIEIGSGMLPTLKPYERKTIQIKPLQDLLNWEEQQYLVVVDNDKEKLVLFKE